MSTAAPHALDLIPSDCHESNRRAWNEAAASYERDLDAQVAFLRSGGTNFIAPEYEYLEGLRDWCRRAIHLQCAGGSDTLSLWNLGAGEVVGIDISEKMLAVAKCKSDALNAPATWIRSDVLQAPQELNGTADLVYTGRGALCWIMDINSWAGVVARLLKPGGRLFVFESHPISWLWKLDSDHFEIEPGYDDYFQNTPALDCGWPTTYVGDGPAPEGGWSTKYEHQWTLSVVVNAVINAGLTLTRLGEHPDMFWDAYPNIPPDLIRRLPQTYSLLAVKMGGL